MLYDFQCRNCGATALNVYAKIADRLKVAPECCGERMQIVMLEAPMGFVDNMEEYRCPVTGEGVTTRKQRNEIMAREGLVDANDLLKSDGVRQREHKELMDKREKRKASEPKAVREHVESWATKELGL